MLVAFQQVLCRPDISKMFIAIPLYANNNFPSQNFQKHISIVGIWCKSHSIPAKKFEKTEILKELSTRCHKTNKSAAVWKL